MTHNAEDVAALKAESLRRLESWMDAQARAEKLETLAKQMAEALRCRVDPSEKDSFGARALAAWDDHNDG